MVSAWLARKDSSVLWQQLEFGAGRGVDFMGQLSVLCSCDGSVLFESYLSVFCGCGDISWRKSVDW